MHAAKRDGSGGKADVRGLAGYFQRLGQRFDRRRRNEADRASLPIAADDRAVRLPRRLGQHPADSLRHFGIAPRFGRAGWEPRCEDYLPAGVEERLDLCESFGADYLRRRHDQRAQRLGLMLAFQQKAPLRDARPLAREHFGVQIDEVAPEPVGQPATYLHVIHVRHADSAFVGGQRAVEPVAGLHRLDRIEYGDVRRQPRVVLQQDVQPAEKRVELVQPVAVQRVTVRQLGQERHVPVVVPDGVRDQHVDSLGVLVLRDAVDRVPRDVAHGSVGFRHRERAVPVDGRRADYLVEPLGRPVAADLVDAGNVLVFETLHQVGRRADRILALLVVLMSGGQRSVRPAPLADELGIGRRVLLGPQREHCVPGRSRFGTDIVPQGGVEQRRAAAVRADEVVVERRSPAASFGTI